MSNPYRKQAADDESRLDRVLEARMIIEAEAAQGGQRAEALQARLLSHYEEQGGLDVDSQIEGLMLVIEEGKLYRKAALKFAAQMQDFHQGKQMVPPNPPEKAAISAATMVGASRQLERLALRRQYLKEEAELNVALALSIHEQLSVSRKERGAEPANQTAAPQQTPKAAPTFREDRPATHSQRAAAAAA